MVGAIGEHARRLASGSRHSPFVMSSEPRRPFPSAEPIKTQVSAYRLWLAPFDLAVSHPNLQARLWMHGWAIKHTTIVKRKSRGVIWTNNTVPDQFAFRKRPTKMRARLRHREDSLSATNKQNGHAVIYCTGWDAVRQFRFSENGPQSLSEILHQPCDQRLLSARTPSFHRDELIMTAGHNRFRRGPDHRCATFAF